MNAAQQSQKIMDVPGEFFEKYLAATSVTLAGLPPQPTQAQIQDKLVEAATKIGANGPHAAVLAMRYVLFVDILTKYKDELISRALFDGTSNFALPFIAAIARLPAKFVFGVGPIYKIETLWIMTDAAKAPSKSAAPASSP